MSGKRQSIFIPQNKIVRVVGRASSNLKPWIMIAEEKQDGRKGESLFFRNLITFKIIKKITEIEVRYPSYMERSCGFTIPENGIFYVVSFEDLVLYNIHTNDAITIKQKWNIHDSRCLIIIGEKEIPFIGLWGGKPLLVKQGVG